LAEMLKIFESRSSIEKLHVTANETAWSELFSSLLDESSEYDRNDLRIIFRIYFESSLKNMKLMETINFDNETDDDRLQITVLNALFNAYRKKTNIIKLRL
jgi:hypothetical protein